MKHIHAELMMEYAKDAMETDEPWLRWEFYSSSEQCWKQFRFDHPAWHFEDQYRRKTRTININGHEVPEPYRGEMFEGQIYYTPLLGFKSKWMREEWSNSEHNQLSMTIGLIHFDNYAAIAHAEALESFTKM